MTVASVLPNIRYTFCVWPGGSLPAQGALIHCKENTMQTTDFLVHIDETLNQSELEAIEDNIRHGSGVVSAGHRTDKPHFVHVIYDSDSTRMAEIVEDVRQHGLHAQAVGM